MTPPEANGKKIEMIEDIATLKSDVRHLKDEQEKNHDELMGEFRALRKKVNDEITTMQVTIKDNRTFLLRILIGALVIGSFLWIQESRDWILRHIFNIV